MDTLIKQDKKLAVALSFALYIIAFFSYSVLLFISIPTPVYYALLLSAGCLAAVSGKKLNFSMPQLIFLSICIVNILTHNIPTAIQPWSRFGLLALLVIFIGGGTRSDDFTALRKKLFFMIANILLICSALSLFFYLTGITFPGGRGVVYGLFRHSMILGPLAGFSVIWGFSRAKSGTEREKYLYLSLTVLAFGSCLLSGSRAAVFATVLGAGIQLLRSSKLWIAIMILLVSGLLLWEGYEKTINAIPFAQNIIEKQEANLHRGSTFASRESMWLLQIQCIQEAPVSGIGFGYLFGAEDSDSVEPGSSWLFICSTLGIIGLLGFLLIYGRLFLSLYPNLADGGESYLLFSELIFWGAHMCFEGYILSAGSPLAFLAWLTIGRTQDFLIENKIIANHVTAKKQVGVLYENYSSCPRNLK